MLTEKKRTPLAHWIVRQRYIVGLSQNELAERADLSVATINALETGQSRSMTPRTLHKLADALQSDPEELVDVMIRAQEEHER